MSFLLNPRRFWPLMFCILLDVLQFTITKFTIKKNQWLGSFFNFPVAIAFTFLFFDILFVLFQIINLSNNHLNDLPVGIFRDMASLTSVDLSNNRIKNLVDNLIPSPALER